MMTRRKTIPAHNMSKQRSNNNKGPANRRPASSKGKANSNETGKRPKTRNTKTAASRSSSRGDSERSASGRQAFDKKPAGKRSYTKREEGSSEFKGKSEGRAYASKKSSRTFGDNERSGPRSTTSKPASKRSYTKRDDNSLEYKSRAGEGKSSYSAKKPSRAYDDNDRSEGHGTGKPSAKRSIKKREDASSEFKSRAGEGRSAYGAKKPSRASEDNENTKSRSDAKGRPSSTRRDEHTREDKPHTEKKSLRSRSFDENEPSFHKRLSSIPDTSPVKPAAKRASKKESNDDEESDDDYFLEGASTSKPKFDKGEIKKGRKSYTNKLDKLSKNKPNTSSINIVTPFETRLNKYISNSGVCSRREADQLIIEGLVKVNGIVITELGYKVQVGDSVKYNNKVLNPEKSVYVLLNKPKDFITTMEDENNRKTVMQLVANATKERIYPVGRLDRNTTGLLLFTNDGELAQKLTHPSNKIKKIYEVELDKSITAEDFDKIADGKIHLFDGPVKVDEIAIISPNKKILGVEIHEGRNRIVRRIFESLGYEVLKLDRVMYAGLTKKNVPRGSWRYLTATEVNKIKYLD